ncbi:putative F-box protein At3g18330 [Lolium rigidum]|uniref:putative F-box protein At3g18330 n=1 Tax=Lolium rigidum TaxID=89674 RepID=UPI001F5D4BE6|nr:putative F-box protein At3g18330 [Lolium rigidum]
MRERSGDYSPNNCQNEAEKEKDHPEGSLPAEVLMEILSHVPYKSLCRFKCVSKPWLAFCSEPDICKRCPQTLSGFFYNYGGRVSFHNLSGRGPPMVDPSLPFLRGSYDRFEVKQCCGGLLLCECWESRHEEDKHDFVVCNPITGKWTVLPPILWQNTWDGDPVRFQPIEIFLGFDAAVPSCFTVFVPLTYYEEEFTEMAIYSSKTRRWITVEGDPTTQLVGNSECVFLNGTMHLATKDGSIVSVDAKGEEWCEIDMPNHMEGSRRSKVSIGQSQGRLHVWQISNDDDDDAGDDDYDNDDYGDGDGHLYVWVLKDYDSEKWRLKCNVRVSELFKRECGEDDFSYTAFAIHPESNCIFLTDKDETTLSYDMDNLKVKVVRNFQEFQDALPYTPCFAEWS